MVLLVGVGSSPKLFRGPFRLDFDKVFLRAPVGPHESDLIVSDDRLRAWATLIWPGRRGEEGL